MTSKCFNGDDNEATVLVTLRRPADGLTVTYPMCEHCWDDDSDDDNTWVTVKTEMTRK